MHASRIQIFKFVLSCCKLVSFDLFCVGLFGQTRIHVSAFLTLPPPQVGLVVGWAGARDLIPGSPTPAVSWIGNAKTFQLFCFSHQMSECPDALHAVLSCFLIPQSPNIWKCLTTLVTFKTFAVSWIGNADTLHFLCLLSHLNVWIHDTICSVFLCFFGVITFESEWPYWLHSKVLLQSVGLANKNHVLEHLMSECPEISGCIFSSSIYTWLTDWPQL